MVRFEQKQAHHPRWCGSEENTLAKPVRLQKPTRVIRPRRASGDTLEWRLQAAGVRALRAMPGYGERPGPNVRFTLAGDFNAARRSPQESVKAKATGLTAGEHDVRIYLEGGRLGLIEVKNKNGRLSPAQQQRHPLLASLGFNLQAVVKAETEAEAAEAFVRIVSGWLAANDN